MIVKARSHPCRIVLSDKYYFFRGNKDKPEIIRQNFDDVVNEQERKILGKEQPKKFRIPSEKPQDRSIIERFSYT